MVYALNPVVVAILLLSMSCVSAFRNSFLRTARRTALPAANVETFAKNMILTETLKARSQEKVGKLINKLGRDSVWAHVVLKVLNLPVTESHSQLAKHNCHIAEVTVGYKGGAVVHASERSDDMYTSIDLVAHKLAHCMRKHHEKLVDNSQKAPAREQVEVDQAEVDASADADEEAFMMSLDKKYENVKTTAPGERRLQVVKQKLFSMPPISVEEAVNALELIDHPFYMFRNKATNEINLVYRREAGGVGHIVPKGDH